MSEDTTAARPGSGADLSRRMDRIEQRQDSIEQEVRSLATTVGRVEQNQVHATELNKLRFDALDAGIKAVSATLSDFMRRIEGVITGEIETQQSRTGRELVADYQTWRKGVDEALDQQAVLNGQVRLLGRLAVLLASSQVLAIAAAIYALLK